MPKPERSVDEYRDWILDVADVIVENGGKLIEDLNPRQYTTEPRFSVAHLTDEDEVLVYAVCASVEEMEAELARILPALTEEFVVAQDTNSFGWPRLRVTEAPLDERESRPSGTVTVKARRE